MDAEFLVTFQSILLLMILMGICIVAIKLINGDFSVKSIEEINRQNIENGINITYKYTYGDDRVKIKSKVIK